MATIVALESLRTAETVARLRGKTVAELGLRVEPAATPEVEVA